MRKPINVKEFKKLMNYINKFHGWMAFETNKYPKIKYIRSHYDTRFNDFYGIELDEKSFFIVNDNRDKDLLAWIAEYLGTKKEIILK